MKIFAGILVESDLPNVFPRNWRDVHVWETKDEADARKWLEQKFVNDEEYRVVKVTFKRRDCCRAIYGTKRTQVLKPSEYLSNE